MLPAIVILPVLGAILGFIIDSHNEKEKSSEKVSGTPLADDADSVPSSVPDDSDKASESTDNLTGETPP